MSNKIYFKENEWVNEALKYAPDANKEVLTFISDFLHHNGSDMGKMENIRSLFRNGYCLYFAKMLEGAFERGTVVICAPIGHIAWQDTDGQVYDIEGVADTDAEYFIPISYLGDAIDDFKHIRGKAFNISEEQIQTIINRYKADTVKNKYKLDTKIDSAMIRLNSNENESNPVKKDEVGKIR